MKFFGILSFSYIRRPFGYLGCLVYDNGNPDMPEISLSQLITTNVLLENTNPAVAGDYKCYKFEVDYTTGADTTTKMYCMPPCSGRLAPVQRNPSPDFCYHLYQGSAFDILISWISFLSNHIEEQLSGFKEYSFCSPDTINGGKCPEKVLGLTSSLKGCRPASRGLWSLPPGESSCLIFLNGHDWPVGATALVAATFLAGTSFLSAVVGGSGGTCMGPMYCRVGNQCCTLQYSRGRLICPSRC